MLTTFVALLVAMAPVWVLASSAQAQAPGSRIVLIGGEWSLRINEHDWPHGIAVMEALLENSAQVETHGLSVESHPYGWPANLDLDDIGTVVLYFSGTGKNPLLDVEKRRALATLMERGVGLVAYHQAFTLPEGDTTVPLKDWLGAVRYGKFDRTTKPALLQVASGPNPVTNGLEDFLMNDEFYPTLQFNVASGKILPVWHAELPVHVREGVQTVSIQPQVYVLAWAYERENGGRSFGYSGAHFLDNWDEPQMRTAFLNAILWTAGKAVPDGGAETDAAEDVARVLEDPGMAQQVAKGPVVTRAVDNERIETPWGRIDWYASGPLGNSATMTIGQATVFPGKSNPVHFHPNCDEILRVLSGTILHSVDGETVELSAGDTITIPQNVRHNATNLGDEDATLAISFNSAWREVVGE